MQNLAELKIQLLNEEIKNLEGKISKLQEQVDSKKKKISQIEYHENTRGIKKEKVSTENPTV